MTLLTDLFGKKIELKEFKPHCVEIFGINSLLYYAENVSSYEEYINPDLSILWSNDKPHRIVGVRLSCLDMIKEALDNGTS
jgi:hypothetical protein